MDCFQPVTMLLVLLSLYTIEGRMKDLSIEENLILDEEFGSLNNHAQKTIKTKYGDIYDCVNLYEQPAFDHPLLKDHKIQMRPSFAQRRVVSDAKADGVAGTSINIELEDECPSGTVPIRRTTKEEYVIAKSSFRDHFPGSYSVSRNGRKPGGFAIAGILTLPRKATVYHGAGGFASINNPMAGPGQYSASVISIEGGPNDQRSGIRVGWMVSPDVFRDNRTRLYTIWAQGVDGFMHGCINTYCSGFVQLDTKIPLGKVLEPISVVRGPQYYLKLSVSQDKNTGNWWLKYGESDRAIGYWSSSLFTHLKDGAEMIRWGGMVKTITEQLPSMGNGDNGNIHSSHFKQIGLLYESGPSLNGSLDASLKVMQTPCYKVGDNSYKGEVWGYSFYFGGDGGDVNRCKSTHK